MKRLLCLLLLVVSCANAQMIQENWQGTGVVWAKRPGYLGIYTMAAPGGLVGLDASNFPVAIAIGSGLSLSGGVISTTASAATAWGTITGTLSTQADLNTALNLKAPLISPAFTTPSLGVATATSINGNTFTAGTYTLTGAASKTLTFNNSLTLAGTDATVMTFPTTSATIARTDAANTFTGNQSFTGTIAATQNTNGLVAHAIRNTSALGSAFTEFDVGNDTAANQFFVGVIGSGNSGTFGGANSGYMGVTGSNTLALITASTMRLTISGTGVVDIPIKLTAHGTSTNDSASAGYIGEQTESVIAAASEVSLTSTAAANVTSISLTAGDWAVEGDVIFDPGATTNITQATAWTSSTSATLPSIDLATRGQAFLISGGSVPGAIFSVHAPRVRYSLSGTTTVYLSVRGDFTVSTLKAFGAIRAWRTR